MAKKNQSAFEKALTDAALSRYQKILDEDTSPVQLSDTYKDSVVKLTNKSSRKTWKYVNTAWKRVLIAVIMMFLLAATAFAAVPALREGLIRFFMHDDGVAFTFEFSQEDLDRAPKEIERYYAPSYIPDQYELVSEEYRPVDEQRIYLDNTGNVLAFSQYALWQFTPDSDSPDVVASVLGITSENVTVETLVLHGYQIKVLHIHTPNSAENVEILWTDHEYFYSIGAPAISTDEIDRIIGSLAPVEP